MVHWLLLEAKMALKTLGEGKGLAWIAQPPFSKVGYNTVIAENSELEQPLTSLLTLNNTCSAQGIYLQGFTFCWDSACCFRAWCNSSLGLPCLPRKCLHIFMPLLWAGDPIPPLLCVPCFASFFPPACTGFLPPPDLCRSRSCLHADLPFPPNSPGEWSLPPHPFSCPLSPSSPPQEQHCSQPSWMSSLSPPWEQQTLHFPHSLLHQVCFLSSA